MSREFFGFCANNKLDMAKTLFEKGGIDLGFYYAGNTALLQATYKGHVDVVKWLIQVGSPVDAKNSEEKTSLIRASILGHLEIAEALLGAGADINAVDKEGRSALIHAILNKHEGITFLLIENGADMHVPDKSGQSALGYAERYKILDAVNQLLELCSKKAGGDSQDGCTDQTEMFEDFNFKLVVINALLNQNYQYGLKGEPHYATHLKQPPSFMAELEELINKYEGYEDSDDYNYKPIPEIMEFFSRLKLTQTDLDQIEELCFDGGNTIYGVIHPLWDGEDDTFNIRSVKGFEHLKNLKTVDYVSLCDEEVIFPILDSLKGDSEEDILRNLLKQNITDLRIAVEKNNPDGVWYHIKKGANVNVPDYMITAIEKKATPIIKMLIEAGFNVTDAPDEYLKNPYHIKNICYLSKFIHRYKMQSEDKQEFIELLPLFLNAIDEFDFESIKYVMRNFHRDVPDECYTSVLDKWADINEQDDKGETVLHYILQDPNTSHNNADRWIDTILDRDGLDVNIFSYSDIPPLYYACAYKSPEIVRNLLIKGADVDALCDKESKPLTLIASKFNRADNLEVLYEFGADSNATDKNGCSPLHIACMMRNIDLCRFLLEKGADPSVTDKYSDTPLHLLLSVFTSPYSHDITYWKNKKIPFADYKAIIDLLIENGAILEAVNNHLRTPFFEYCYSNKEQDFLLLKHLLSLGASVDFQDKDEKTCLHYAIKRNNINLVKFLLENGADSNVKDAKGVSPYQLALDENKRAIISVIEKANVSIDMEGDDMDAAFMRACKNGRRGVAEMLMRSGNIDVTYVDDYGRTPLHYIAGMGAVALAKFVIENGVDLNYTDRNSQTALHFAASNHQKEVFKLLIENGADPSIADSKGVLPIHLITNRGQHDLLSVLLDHGANTSVMTNAGQSLLHVACYTRNKECVRRLLEHGMPPDILDKGGVTPLIVSVNNNQKEIVKILLAAGANIRARDIGGDEGIHIAVMSGFKDMLLLLIENGSDINALNNQGLAPLHLAAYCGFKDIFKCLLERGADFEIKTGAGKSCIDIAAENGQKELIELIGIIQKRRKMASGLMPSGSDNLQEPKIDGGYNKEAGLKKEPVAKSAEDEVENLPEMAANLSNNDTVSIENTDEGKDENYSNDDKGEVKEDKDDAAPGWDAITEAFDKLYPGQHNPMHFGTLVKYRLGGKDPLDGISIYDGGEFYHFVTYGFSELYEKENDNPEVSGFGFELTLKLKKTPSVDETELKSMCGVLQGLARYVFDKGARFVTYKYIYTKQKQGFDAKGRSKLTGFITAPDEAGVIDTPNGKLEFVQLVGITENELQEVYEKRLTVKALLATLPNTYTDYERDEQATCASELDEDYGSEDKENRGSVISSMETVTGSIVQTLTKSNMSQAQAKSVAAVRELFEKKGYEVDLSVGNKGTDKEYWQFTCILLSPMSIFVAGFGYDADWADQIGKGQISSAAAQNMELKTDGCWFYYGSPDAITMFESFGTINPVVLFAAEEKIKDPGVAAVEEAFRNAGYIVTVSPHPDGTQLTCILHSPHSVLIAGTGSLDWVNMMSDYMKAQSVSFNYEFKRKDNWFYCGTPDAIKVFEGVT